MLRFLKRYKAGESKEIVDSVTDENGWEAWRELHHNFEPQVNIPGGQAMNCLLSTSDAPDDKRG